MVFLYNRLKFRANAKMLEVSLVMENRENCCVVCCCPYASKVFAKFDHSQCLYFRIVAIISLELSVEAVMICCVWSMV